MTETTGHTRFEYSTFFPSCLFRFSCFKTRISNTAMMALTCLIFTGCGPDRPEMVPVSGTVTFGGAVPPADAPFTSPRSTRPAAERNAPAGQCSTPVDAMRRHLSKTATA